ncbi:MAG: glycoside hydrolase family 95 protein, partial [Eubacterium sp.]
MKNTLYYTKKANCFEEALPVGNGRMGAMVYGNLKNEKISLNEDTLWSGYPKDLNTKDAHTYLDEIRQNIFSGNYEKAEALANSKFHGHWCESYLPFGNLEIHFTSSVSKKGYKRTLDISKGLAVTACKGITETVFASHPANLIVVNLKSDTGFSCRISFSSQLQHKVYTEKDVLVMEGAAPEICQPPYHTDGIPVVYGDKAMKFAGAAKVLGSAAFENGAITVDNQKEITVLISLATSFIDFKTMPTANALERAMQSFDSIKSYEQLLDEHVKDFSALFDRVDFTLLGGNSDMPTNKRLKAVRRGTKDNALIALLFQYGRYLTISASRKGTAAMNLQGIWNEHLRAPWSSNYTININTQMNYWCTDICNLSECFEPLTALVKKLAEKGTVTAKDYYGCGGFCAHHNSDIWGNTNPAGHPKGDGNDSSYSIWQASAPWLLVMLYDHYLYTRDEAYKEEIKPLFKANLDFYKDFLIEHNGESVTCPSLSPENTYISKNGAHCLTYMPNMDREILYDFFKICREFGFETPEIEQVRPASDGRIPEWCEEFGEKEPQHRHVSHLYCIYPSPFAYTQELKTAAEKSLYARCFGGTGWSIGWKVCLWARLGNGENAHKLILNMLRPI